MTPRSRLTLPGLALLLALALVLAYLEQRSGEGGGTPASGPAPAATGVRPAEAGDFDYYTLVLAWSPTHCATPEGQDDETQCARRDGRRYAFILHGLWPQYEQGYPESCPTRGRPYVPQPVIDAMMDIMPSKRLIIHEYRKHGTCSGLAPEAYFQTARRLHGSLVVPPQFRNPTEAQFLDPKDVIAAFARANPQLEPGMIAVSCAGPGSRMREVRICFSKTGTPRSCGANEAQGRLCRTSRMHVPPVRPRPPN